MDSNQEQQEATNQNGNIAFSNGIQNRILRFLEENAEKEYNASTISKCLSIPLNKTTATLSRACKTGKIWRPQRGFYAYNCTLNKHQILKIERNSPIGIHGLIIILPKDTHSKNSQLLSPTVGSDVAILDSSESNGSQQIATPDDGDTFEVGPNQKVTIKEYSDKFMIIVKASENPLTIRELFWLFALLKLRFGEATMEDGIISRWDINKDIPVSFSPNQITIGDLEGQCLAIYGKGNNTRIELRNFHPEKLLIKSVVKNLFNFEAIATSKPETEDAKATNGNIKQHETSFEYERLPIPIKTGGEAATLGYA